MRKGFTSVGFLADQSLADHPRISPMHASTAVGIMNHRRV